MIWMAFTLGFLGSLHCVGMCGPLALLAAGDEKNHLYGSFMRALQYNVGRVLTYAFLGLGVGLIGELILLSDFQKTLSLLAGFFLLALFFFSLDLEKLLFKSEVYRAGYQKVSSYLSSHFKRGVSKFPFFVGMINGLLPCGLVYLALTGAMVAGGVEDGALFMIFFGLGTFPAMAGIMIIGSKTNSVFFIKKYIPRIFQFTQLALGLYLMYRGMVVDIPEELNFWTAVKNPVLCH